VLTLAAALAGGAALTGPVSAVEPGGDEERASIVQATGEAAGLPDCQPGVAMTGDQMRLALTAEDRDGVSSLDGSSNPAEDGQYVVFYSETIVIER
jgi:hypothetical protein